MVQTRFNSLISYIHVAKTEGQFSVTVKPEDSNNGLEARMTDVSRENRLFCESCQLAQYQHSLSMYLCSTI